MRRCRIEASVGFLAFLCAYYYFDPIGSFVPFVISAALHELGHVAAMCLLRVPIHRLSLTLGGAVLQTPTLSYRQELFICCAGPLVNVLLLCLSARRFPMFGLMNLCLFLYNMLPIYPLDGGRMLRALLQLLLTERLANFIERMLTCVCLLLLVGACVYLSCVRHIGLWPAFVGAFVLLRIPRTFLTNRANST